jgi:hypothetical protein
MGYLKLTTARTEFLDNWICDETLYRLLSAHLPHLKNNTFKFTRKLLIQAIGAKAVLSGPSYLMSRRGGVLFTGAPKALDPFRYTYYKSGNNRHRSS